MCEILSSAYFELCATVGILIVHIQIILIYLSRLAKRSYCIKQQGKPTGKHEKWKELLVLQVLLSPYPVNFDAGLTLESEHPQFMFLEGRNMLRLL